MQIYVPLVVALLGLLLWALCGGATVKGALGKLGEVMLWAGLFACMFAVATHVLRL